MIKVKACRVEFNFSSDSDSDRQSSTNQDDLISIIGSDLENNENQYNVEILRQLFLDFQVESEEGRSAVQC